MPVRSKHTNLTRRQKAAPGVLGEHKIKKLEEETGRHIAFAVANSDREIEFVTTAHEHFLFDKRRKTFKAIPPEEVQHFTPGCTGLFGGI